LYQLYLFILNNLITINYYYYLLLLLVEPILSEISWSIIQPDKANPNLEFIFLKPKNVTSDKLPLIVVPHGGPHSVSTLGVELYSSVLVSLGYAIIGGINIIKIIHT